MSGEGPVLRGQERSSGSFVASHVPSSRGFHRGSHKPALSASSGPLFLPALLVEGTVLGEDNGTAGQARGSPTTKAWGGG